MHVAYIHLVKIIKFPICPKGFELIEPFGRSMYVNLLCLVARVYE